MPVHLPDPNALAVWALTVPILLSTQRRLTPEDRLVVGHGESWLQSRLTPEERAEIGSLHALALRCLSPACVATDGQRPRLLPCGRRSIDLPSPLRLVRPESPDHPDARLEA
jgi:hypothetical protein